MKKNINITLAHFGHTVYYLICVTPDADFVTTASESQVFIISRAVFGSICSCKGNMQTKNITVCVNYFAQICTFTLLLLLRNGALLAPPIERFLESISSLLF